ncbi:MAG: hypothetical protein KJZ78_11565 [Bryobacteraceae bacterium]|nr:hypothetical protein [Bryobacteraceae bacterium]
MRPTRRLLIQLLAVPVLARAQASVPKRLRRADCFFGMHFDLHPNAEDKELGRDVNDAMVDAFLDRVQPDYVQYDCKGHVGYLGFPSETGTSAPGIVNDSLEIWRRVTARRGVALFIHFSGVLDELAVKQHPEWAAVMRDGKTAAQQISTFGPYVDERMIPQLKEAIQKYDIDGAWVDGECWGTNPDYSQWAAEAWRKASGTTGMPRTSEEPRWQEFLEFNREQFRRYVRHYVDKLHSFKPSFQIASNWLYSTFVPEKPDLPVDFISGDYLGNAPISTARLEARYMAATGKPWDLMAWGFQVVRGDGSGRIHKPAVQLQQEAAVVLAQGGGFQIYYQPTRAGKLDDRHINVMASVAKFCRARQELSHKSEPEPQVGLLFSRQSLYGHTSRLFGGWGAASNPARGLLDALLESHYSVDVIPDWKLADVAALYPLIAAPDWIDIGAASAGVLLEYARRGGRLLIAGSENARLFQESLGVRFLGEPGKQSAYVPGGEVFGNLPGLWQDVETVSARSVENRYPTYDSTRDAKCAASVCDFGKGKIAAIYGPVGAVFAASHAPAVRKFLHRVTSGIFTPDVSIEAPPTVEMALRRKHGQRLVHLINVTAMQVSGDYAAIDYVPSAGPIVLKVRGTRPRSVRIEPGGITLSVSPDQKAGTWKTEIPSIHLHEIVSVDG